MPHVLKGALDPRVTPGGILFRHPHDQAANLGENTLATGPLVPVRPLPDDELPMPPQQGVGRRDGGDLPQGPTAQPVRPRCEPTAIIVGETQSPGPKLAPQESVLFDQVSDRLPLPAVQPTSTNNTIWSAEGSITRRSL